MSGIQTRRNYKPGNNNTKKSSNTEKPGNSDQNSLQNKGNHITGTTLTEQQKKGDNITKNTETPTNTGSTSKTTNSMCYVYLEPCNYEETTMKHQVDVGKALAAKGIRSCQDIEPIGKFRFKVTFKTEYEAKLLSETDLTQLNLKCYTPTILKQTIGLIKGVPAEYTDREIEENLDANKTPLKVERMQRRNQEGHLVGTKNVKITFNGRELPDRVAIYGCFFKVELYLFPIKQCRKCWGYGHKAEKCHRKDKCNRCGLETHDGDCQEEKCINCKGKHPASDRNCPERKKQQAISEKMQREKTSFKEAKDQLTVQNGFELLVDNTQEFPPLQQQSRRTNVQGSQYRSVLTEQIDRTQGKDPITTTRKQSWPGTEYIPEYYTTITNNPHRTTALERLQQEIKEFWRKWNLVRRLTKLQAGINGELLNKDATEISYEQLLIKISTTIQEIIEEFTADEEGGTTNNQEEKEESMSNNV